MSVINASPERPESAALASHQAPRSGARPVRHGVAPGRPASLGAWFGPGQQRKWAYLRDTLAVLAAEEDGPGDTAGVLALQEERLRLALLEAEDLAVTTDVELTLLTGTSVSTRSSNGS